MDTRNAVIVAAARTPVGKKGRSLADKTATDLGVIAANEALRRAGMDAGMLDEVIYGNCGGDPPNIARCVALRLDGDASARERLPAYTVQRNCGSGHQAIMDAAMHIELGRRDVVLAGGTESMTGYTMRFADGVKVGNRLKDKGKGLLAFKRDVRLGDLKDLGDDLVVKNDLWHGLSDPLSGMTMPATAEKLAQKYGLDRAELDSFAVMSHKRAYAAQVEGHFNVQIVPVNGVRTDECVQRNPSFNEFAKEPRIGGAPGTGLETDLITALNACPTNDGGAAVLLMSEEKARQLKLPILAYVAAYEGAACDPAIMGIGPSHSNRAVLREYARRTGRELRLGDVEHVEINEAFAAVPLANAKELGLSLDRLNPYGGAIALGHPVGATGARITADTVYNMARTGIEYAINSACVGGGQGVSILFQRPRDADLATSEDARKHTHPELR